MTRTCGQMIVHELLVETVPGYRANRLAAEAATRELIDSGRAMLAAAELVTLPVVVHVVYRTDEENVSDEQVASQIDALNRDFRAANEDRSQVPGVVDVARRRREHRVHARGHDAHEDRRRVLRAPTTPSSRRTRAGSRRSSGKLNLWCCSLGQCAARLRAVPGRAAGDRRRGRSSTPRSGPPARVQEPFHLGRTAVHEVGHWLGLRHIWGDMQRLHRRRLRGRHAARPSQANTGKPTFPHITCNNGPNGDMFMNYMDYTDDDAMFMFTVGQIARMNATLAGPRADDALAARA